MIKKHIFFALFCGIFTFLLPEIYAQTADENPSAPDETVTAPEESAVESESSTSESEVELHPVTGFPEISKKPFVMFNESVNFAQVTRLEQQEERSNFVRESYMAGAGVTMQTGNMQPMDSLIRISAYYPFYHTFNGMQQTPKQIILYAFDLFAGPFIELDMWKYIQFKLGIGLHYMYQLTDEYHMHYVGAGALAGFELPIARHWTILLNGTATIDYPNFGTNRNIQPFLTSWQYALEFGFRYSKKGAHEYSYINSRKAK